MARRKHNLRRWCHHLALCLWLGLGTAAARTGDHSDAVSAVTAAGTGIRADAHPQPKPQPAPQRVVSLDYCADQYALKLLDRGQLLALSPDATAEYSYLRASAAGIPQVRPRAEEVLALAPDLILRSYGGGPNAKVFFERAGVRVVSIRPGNTIAAVVEALTATAMALGVPERGQATLTELRKRLAAIEPPQRAKSALYLTPAGFTSGPGALVHELLTAAGLQNFEQAPGWRPVSLERLAYEQPQVIAAAFFEGTLAERTDAWNPLRHPLLREQLAAVPRVVLPSAWTACGGWFLIDAVERLSAAAHE